VVFVILSVAKNLVLYAGITLFPSTMPRMAPYWREEKWNLGAEGRDSSLRSE
jgi:cytochrome b subunit of formate dehydrogenase